jgi:hypothetical protein
LARPDLDFLPRYSADSGSGLVGAVTFSALMTCWARSALTRFTPDIRAAMPISIKLAIIRCVAPATPEKSRKSASEWSAFQRTTIYNTYAVRLRSSGSMANKEGQSTWTGRGRLTTTRTLSHAAIVSQFRSSSPKLFVRTTVLASARTGAAVAAASQKSWW